MQYIKDRNQLTFDVIPPWHGVLTEKKVKRLENTWAGVFRSYITLNLPVQTIAANYSEHMGRPTKELITVMGAVVLQQIFDLTDERTVDEVAFNQQWHYALDSYNSDDQMMAERTLWGMRHLMLETGIDQEIFKRVTDHLADAFKVDTRFQRLDSVHIHSNMACLGRVRLMTRTIAKFLKNLRRQYREVYESTISDALSARYFKEQSSGYFGKVRPSETKRRLDEIARDLYGLIEVFSAHDNIRALYSFKLLQRVFREQCRVVEGEVVVVPAKEVSSDSLQNPSDPDATYDGHKGQGYQVQVLETFTPTGAEQPESGVSAGDEADSDSEKAGAKPALNLITHVEVEPAHVHDSSALKPALEDVGDRRLVPQELLADAAYGSDKNVGQAKSCSVALIAPLPGRKGDKSFDGFVFNVDRQVIETCPGGHSPERSRQNRRKGSLTAFWKESTCEGCSLRESGGCPVVKGRRGFRLQYLAKDVRVYQRRKAEEGETFKSKYRYRAGIEGTNSRYVHMTGAKRLRYRGLPQVRFAGITKALGINLFRTAKYVRETSKLLEDNVRFGLKWAANCTKSVVRTIKKAFNEILGESLRFTQFAVVKL